MEQKTENAMEAAIIWEFIWLGLCREAQIAPGNVISSHFLLTTDNSSAW